jgi:hypothetical protein
MSKIRIEFHHEQQCLLIIELSATAEVSVYHMKKTCSHIYVLLNTLAKFLDNLGNSEPRYL